LGDLAASAGREAIAGVVAEVVTAIEQSWGWGGWRLGLFFSVPLFVATAQVLSFGHEFVTAWAPGLAMSWYGVALIWLNRTKVQIGLEGVRFTYGPLPSGARNRHFPRSAVARFYVRSYVDRSRYGGFYKAVGIQTHSGYAHDFEREELPAKAMAQTARRYMSAVEWREAAVEIEGSLPGREVQGFASGAPILVAFTLSGFWVLWVFR